MVLIVPFVFLAIVAVTISLFVPSTRRVREASARTQIINNLKQVGLAIHVYHDVHKQLPSATGGDSTSWGNGFPLSIHLLPYVEQRPLYERYVAGETVKPVVVPPYVAPLDFTTSDALRVQNFAGNVRTFTDIGIKTPFDATVLGLKAQYTEAAFDKIIPAIQAGTYNVGMSSFTDNKEREKTVDFVTPYGGLDYQMELVRIEHSDAVMALLDQGVT